MGDKTFATDSILADINNIKAEILEDDKRKHTFLDEVKK